MSESGAEFADRRQVSDLGPLTLTREGERWRFRLAAPSEIMLELPPDYERHLTESLQPLLAAGGKPDIVVDLQELPALSSRQLGLMLALRQALRGHCERLPVTGVSTGVRHLLALTRTEQFFDIS